MQARTARTLIVAVTLAFAVAAGVVWRLRGEQQREEVTSSTRVTDAAVSGDGGSSPAPGSDATPTTVAGAKPASMGADAPVSYYNGKLGLFARIPERYQLTRTNGYANVALDGGAAQLFPNTQRPPGPTRTVVGTVVDVTGTPVADAVVIALLDESGPTITASEVVGLAGATTDAAGAFTMDDVPNTATMVFAVSPRGWSTEVPTATTPLVLRVGRSVLEGRITIDGHADSFALELDRTGDKFSLRAETNRDGTYKIASLPPGDYDVTIQLAERMATGAGQRERRKVTLSEATPVRLDVNMTTGSLVAAIAMFPAGAAIEAVNYWLFTGAAPATPDAAKLRARAEGAPGAMFGGADAKNPMQFHKVAPGKYTVCASGNYGAYYGCTPVTVIDGDDVREVSIPLAATP